MFYLFISLSMLKENKVALICLWKGKIVLSGLELKCISISQYLLRNGKNWWFEKSIVIWDHFSNEKTTISFWYEYFVKKETWPESKKIIIKYFI